jgi:hypothetical protein
MICPCKGCTERTILCHGRCDGYQQWKKEREEINRIRSMETENRQLSREHEIRYRKNVKRRVTK